MRYYDLELIILISYQNKNMKNIFFELVNIFNNINNCFLYFSQSTVN